MSVHWVNLMNDITNAKNNDDIKKIATKCGVDDVHLLIVRSIRTYAYNRDYRERRNQSITELKNRVHELESQLK